MDAPKTFSLVSTTECCDDTGKTDQHAPDWITANMSAVWAYFQISEKDPRIKHVVTAETSRGGATAKTFSASGLIHHM